MISFHLFPNIPRGKLVFSFGKHKRGGVKPPAAGNLAGAADD